ncbi:Acyltransferase [Coniochaeta hoffmannii]|uniref:Acyltransferase n=1 Tax=Coniochaeta hoffmannii TaxID=91930 RepID=A0AA38RI01_9PEZI|nr:Acyltransferase [Coniochaeta hoffmannii]
MAPQSQRGHGLLDRPDWQDGETPDWEHKDFPTRQPTGWKATLKHYLHRLRSSLIRSKPGSGSSSSSSSIAGGSPPSKLRRTAYLDGLRGFAALVVYWQHHVLWAHYGENMMLERGFGFDKKYAFATFHGVRTFFTGGHFAVATFFVISGYALSCKPMQLLQAGDYVKLGDNLASALFRRWLRLYMPLMATTFIYMLWWHLFGFGKLYVSPAKPQSNLRDEIWHWYAEFKNFSFIFNMGGEPWFAYNFHTWSIPVEMKGSIIVYTALQAFSRLTKNARLLAEVGLIFYFLYIADGWYGAMFMAGMLLGDLDLLAIKGELPQFLVRLEPYKTFIYYHLFVISIYFGGVPSHTWDLAELRQTRGWYYLSYLKPQAVFDFKWFYLFWAATFLVASTPRIPWLKRFFETRFCQYLGRISYALYLVHGPVLWIVGDRLYAATGWWKAEHQEFLPWWVDRLKMPKTGPLGLELSFLAPQIVLFPLTFWLAEMATRAFDEPAVRFGQWLYRRGLPTEGKVQQ